MHYGVAHIRTKNIQRATLAGLQRLFGQPFTAAALLICFFFGLALIANVQEADEGSWFWYAKLVRSGQHLYSDLNFSLQPLFPLETVWFQATFGESWLAAKIPSILNLGLFSLAIFLVIRRSTWTDSQMSVVLCCTFLFGIHFESYRFDDYHVLADALLFATALLVLDLCTVSLERRRYAICAMLGIATALTFLTRANDGALLFAFGFVTIIIASLKSRWYSSLAIFVIVFIAVIILGVGLTGDSLVTWATKSLLHVGDQKGGTNEFLKDPGRILATSWAELTHDGFFVIAQSLFIALAWVFLVAPFKLGNLSVSIGKAIIGLIVIVIAACYLLPQFSSYEPAIAFLALGSIAAYFIAATVVLRAFVHLVDPNRWTWTSKELVLLLPFVINVSGSLSSAGSFADLYISIAALIVLIPSVSLIPPGNFRSIFVVLAALLAGTSAWYRFENPASWISYQTFPMFEQRQLVRHPSYGPMIIDTRLKHFIDQVCSLVDDGDPKPELLSLPWDYPNYYCAVPPWHNFVATWFDTTPRALTNDLIDQLRQEPPKWIIYQQQLGVLAAHEQLYNNGLALPQRTIDDLITRRIENGQWSVAYRYSDIYPGSTWILLRTRTSQTPGSNLLPNGDGRHGIIGWKKVNDFPQWSSDRFHAGRFTVTNSSTIPGEAIMSHDVSFPHKATVSIEAWVEAKDMEARGGYGYTIDLYDASTDNVVGSLGYKDGNAPERGKLFTARVVSSDRYQLRLRYQAASGSVSFSRIAVREGFESAPRPNESRTYGTKIVPRGWIASPTRPVWSAEHVGAGGFTVTHTGALVRSTLYHDLSFGASGPVTIQTEIGADTLDVGSGFGYVVDLYDETNDEIVGSLGVPAIISKPKRHSFGAVVNRSHRYRIRLIFDAGMARITFSHLIVEFGTISTARGDITAKALRPNVAPSMASLDKRTRVQ